MKTTLPLLLLAASVTLAPAAVLFSQAGPITVNETDAGSNMAGMTISRDNTSTGTLYFKYTVTNPSSNYTNENYYAGLVLYTGTTEGLGVGNNWGAHAYSVWNASIGDLNSAVPESGQVWQLVKGTDTTQIVFRVDFANGSDDKVTVWLNPDLSLMEGAQNPALTTSFTANATFNELHLREGGGGDGWTFSNIAIAETGSDIGFSAVPEPGASLSLAALGTLLGLRRRRAGR